MNQEIIKIVEENGLEKTQGQMILDNFANFFKEASEWEIKAKAIIVTDVSQIEEIQKAREARLALKTIRVNAENTRKNLKEKSIREGKAIEGIANVIKALIIPIEEHLDKQEKFAENLEAERKARIFAERSAELQKYTDDITLYNYRDMNDESFGKLVNGLQVLFNNKKELERKAEEERIENEKKEAEDRENQRLENIKLKKEAEIIEKERVKERQEQEKKLEIERLKAKKESDARKKVEDELKAKKIEEDRLKKVAEDKIKADKLAKLEEEKQEKLKPEKEKLLAFAEMIKNLETPTDLSIAGRVIVEDAEKKLLAISQEIKLKIKNL